MPSSCWTRKIFEGAEKDQLDAKLFGFKGLSSEIEIDLEVESLNQEKHTSDGFDKWHMYLDLKEFLRFFRCTAKRKPIYKVSKKRSQF